MSKIIKNQISKYLVLVAIGGFSYFSGADDSLPLAKEIHKICSKDDIKGRIDFQCGLFSGCDQIEYVDDGSCFYKKTPVIVIARLRQGRGRRNCDKFLQPKENRKIICDQPMTEEVYDDCEYYLEPRRRYYGVNITCDQLTVCSSISRIKYMRWSDSRGGYQNVSRENQCSIVRFYLLDQ